VILAITSLGGNNAMKEMILAQQQASDMWAFYQAKVVREHLYRIQKLWAEAQLLEKSSSGSLKSEDRKRLEALRQTLADEETRFRTEKKDIEREAKRWEHERDLNLKKDPYFDYAEVLLQIAIVMATIAIIAHSPRMYYFSIGLAVIGAFLSVNGFFLFVKLPFLP
jgi:hypothetical protein